MKKLLVMLLAGAMTLSLVACSDNNTDDTKKHQAITQHHQPMQVVKSKQHFSPLTMITAFGNILKKI